MHDQIHNWKTEKGKSRYDFFLSFILFFNFVTRFLSPVACKAMQRKYGLKGSSIQPITLKRQTTNHKRIFWEEWIYYYYYYGSTHAFAKGCKTHTYIHDFYYIIIKKTKQDHWTIQLWNMETINPLFSYLSTLFFSSLQTWTPGSQLSALCLSLCMFLRTIFVPLFWSHSYLLLQ